MSAADDDGGDDGGGGGGDDGGGGGGGGGDDGGGGKAADDDGGGGKAADDGTVDGGGKAADDGTVDGGGKQADDAGPSDGGATFGGDARDSSNYGGSGGGGGADPGGGAGPGDGGGATFGGDARDSGNYGDGGGVGTDTSGGTFGGDARDTSGYGGGSDAVGSAISGGGDGQVGGTFGGDARDVAGYGGASATDTSPFREGLSGAFGGDARSPSAYGAGGGLGAAGAPGVGGVSDVGGELSPGDILAGESPISVALAGAGQPTIGPEDFFSPELAPPGTFNPNAPQDQNNPLWAPGQGAGTIDPTQPASPANTWSGFGAFPGVGGPGQWGASSTTTQGFPDQSAVGTPPGDPFVTGPGSPLGGAYLGPGSTVNPFSNPDSPSYWTNPNQREAALGTQVASSDPNAAFQMAANAFAPGEEIMGIGVTPDTVQPQPGAPSMAQTPLSDLLFDQTDLNQILQRAGQATPSSIGWDPSTQFTPDQLQNAPANPQTQTQGGWMQSLGQPFDVGGQPKVLREPGQGPPGLGSVGDWQSTVGVGAQPDGWPAAPAASPGLGVGATPGDWLPGAEWQNPGDVGFSPVTSPNLQGGAGEQAIQLGMQDPWGGGMVASPGAPLAGATPVQTTTVSADEMLAMPKLPGAQGIPSAQPPGVSVDQGVTPPAAPKSDQLPVAGQLSANQMVQQGAAAGMFPTDAAGNPIGPASATPQGTTPAGGQPSPTAPPAPQGGGGGGVPPSAAPDQSGAPTTQPGGQPTDVGTQTGPDVVAALAGSSGADGIAPDVSGGGGGRGADGAAVNPASLLAPIPAGGTTIGGTGGADGTGGTGGIPTDGVGGPAPVPGGEAPWGNPAGNFNPEEGLFGIGPNDMFANFGNDGTVADPNTIAPLVNAGQ